METIKNIAPKDSDVWFVLCDDARQELGNKLTLNGIYTSGDLNFEQKASEYAIKGIVFFFQTKSGGGTFNTHIDILDPDNQIAISFPNKTSTIDPGKHALFVAQVAPFKFAKSGQYLARLYLDDTVYERSFRVNFPD